MTVWYTWMNSSRLLEPSYLSIGPSLNLSCQETCLSDGARARKLPLPDGVAAHFGVSWRGPMISGRPVVRSFQEVDQAISRD
jgi:hypothetical protein